MLRVINHDQVWVDEDTRLAHCHSCEKDFNTDHMYMFECNWCDEQICKDCRDWWDGYCESCFQLSEREKGEL